MSSWNLSLWRLLLLFRPKTLVLSLSPVFVGTAYARYEGQKISIIIFGVCILTAMLIQACSNIVNDWKDFEKGADSVERIGPKRAAAEGWFTLKQLCFIALTIVIMAMISGSYLVYVGGIPIGLIGVFSIIFAYGYTAGPWPIAYSPFGEFFVFIFFGIIAVEGTYYLYTSLFSWPLLFISTTLGALAANVLVVNNYRDKDLDKKINKNTLAVLLDRSSMKKIYGAFLTLSFLALLLHDTTQGNMVLWPTYILIPLAISLYFFFIRQTIGKQLNKVLAFTALFQFLVGTTISLSLLFAR